MVASDRNPCCATDAMKLENCKEIIALTSSAPTFVTSSGQTMMCTAVLIPLWAPTPENIMNITITGPRPMMSARMYLPKLPEYISIGTSFAAAWTLLRSTSLA